jgi:hypothetical protein
VGVSNYAALSGRMIGSRFSGMAVRNEVIRICSRESAAKNSKLLPATLHPPAFKTLTSTAERAGRPPIANLGRTVSDLCVSARRQVRWSYVNFALAWGQSWTSAPDWNRGFYISWL